MQSRRFAGRKLFDLALIATLFAVASSVAHAAEVASFRIGIAAPTVNMLPLWVAKEAGLLKNHGLDVEVVNTEGGSRGLAEVGAGELQAMVVGLSAVIDANDKGGHYRLIASGANTMSFRFFGAAGITNAAALKGAKVGVSAFGSESDSAATMALRQLGLTRSDVKVVEAGGTLTRLAALKSGALAATALNEPADSEAKQNGLPLLADLKANLPWIFTAIAVDQNYLAQHRQQMRDFVQSWVEGAYLALSDPALAKRILAEQFQGIPPAALDATYADFRARVPRDAEPSGAGAELMIRELHARHLAPDYLDTSLLSDLRRGGFFDAMKQRYHIR